MSRISLLLPSRGRPELLWRMSQSAFKTADDPWGVEVVVRLDDDDPFLDSYMSGVKGCRMITGPRTLLSAAWNECFDLALADVVMHCGDDITFETKGWDTMVLDTFEKCPDKILFVYGDDLGPNGQVFGTHGFLHRAWVEAVGYFLPPLFSSDWNDVWLNEVAEMIGRKQRLSFVTKHWHYTFGLMERDQTHADREERGERDGVVELYKRTHKDRASDAEKLRAVIAGHR